MTRIFRAVVIPLALLSATLPTLAQKFQARVIQFNGDPEYSDKELLAAGNLKAGAIYTSAEMNDRAQLLLASGVFQSLSFKFDGVDLIYTLAPAPVLYPVRLENLPLAAGPGLDAKLHDRFPLYHGKVPSEGGLLEQVRGALEDLLAAEGIKATVTATPFGVAGTKQVSAMNYSIASPPVRVGTLDLAGVSPAMAARVKVLADHETGLPYDTDNSAANIEHNLATFYADEGYAAVHVKAVRAGAPVISAAAVDIPFTVTVEEGHVYKLGAIHLPPDALVSQAEIDKAAGPPGQPVKGPTMRGVWELIARRYHAKGYVDFHMTPRPDLDEAAGIVNYNVALDPGPVYHLGLLKFDNVSDELRKLLMRNWQMFPGDPFDESYVSSFILRAQTSDPVLQRTLAGVKVSYDVRADPNTHDVNLLIRLERR